ncbi:MAG: hypothetical protein IT494_00145 [Gammaproteobacteria bacterium]|nr:hypothetical protein [Gammaproteobacteria bacterium]
MLLSTAALLLLGALPSPERYRQAQVAEANQALREARAALLGYVLGVNSGANIGYLPCPDTAYLGLPFDPVGSSNTPCGATGTPAIGLLPWGTLHLAPASVPLWYAVSGNYKISPRIEPNAGLPGTLVAGGVSDIVALVLAPGAALPGQNRSGDPYAIAQYLEDSNIDAAGPFVAGGVGNDRFVAITRAEIEALVPP